MQDRRRQGQRRSRHTSQQVSRSSSRCAADAAWRWWPSTCLRQQTAATTVSPALASHLCGSSAVLCCQEWGCILAAQHEGVCARRGLSVLKYYDLTGEQRDCGDQHSYNRHLAFSTMTYQDLTLIVTSRCCWAGFLPPSPLLLCSPLQQAPCLSGESLPAMRARPRRHHRLQPAAASAP